MPIKNKKRKRGKKMKKENLIKKIIENVAIKVAIADANAACPCITHQPQMPKALKKLRKF